MLRFSHIAVIALVGGTSSAGLVACGGDDRTSATEMTAKVEQFPSGTPMRAIQEKGELVVGIKFDAPPFGFKSPGSNDVEGFDADMATQVAQKLGVQARFIETISDNRIPFIQNRRVDVVFATMTIKREREEEVDFTDPYYVSEGRVLVKRGSPIRGVQDLDDKRVCVTVGSTFNQSVREAAPRSRLRGVNGYSECVQLMLTDAVDAVATEDVVLTGLLIQNPDAFEIVGEGFTEEPFGAAIAEDQPELLAFLNEALDEIKSSGAWEKSYQEWVGQYTGVDRDPPTLSLEKTLGDAEA